MWLKKKKIQPWRNNLVVILRKCRNQCDFLCEFRNFSGSWQRFWSCQDLFWWRHHAQISALVPMKEPLSIVRRKAWQEFRQIYPETPSLCKNFLSTYNITNSRYLDLKFTFGPFNTLFWDRYFLYLFEVRLDKKHNHFVRIIFSLSDYIFTWHFLEP